MKNKKYRAVLRKENKCIFFDSNKEKDINEFCDKFKNDSDEITVYGRYGDYYIELMKDINRTVGFKG